MSIRKYDDEHLENEISKTNLYLQGNYVEDAKLILHKYYQDLMTELLRRTNKPESISTVNKIKNIFKGIK